MNIVLDLLIRSQLKCKPDKNTVCVFLTLTILQMKMDSDLKK